MTRDEQARAKARERFRRDGKAQVIRGPYLLRIPAVEGARAAAARAVHGARRGLDDHANEMETMAVRMSIIADRRKLHCGGCDMFHDQDCTFVAGQPCPMCGWELQ